MLGSRAQSSVVIPIVIIVVVVIVSGIIVSVILLAGGGQLPGAGEGNDTVDGGVTGDGGDAGGNGTDGGGGDGGGGGTATCGDSCSACGTQVDCALSAASCHWCGTSCAETCACADGTPVGGCARDEFNFSTGQYCDNGVLVARCSVCACSQWQGCLQNGSCTYLPLASPGCNSCASSTGTYCKCGTAYHPGELVYYMWNFGDGTNLTTTETTLEHDFPTPGLYNVSMIAVDITTGLRSNPATTPVLPLRCEDVLEYECSYSKNCNWRLTGFPLSQMFWGNVSAITATDIVPGRKIIDIVDKEGGLQQRDDEYEYSTQGHIGDSGITRLFTNTTHLFAGIPAEKTVKIYEWPELPELDWENPDPPLPSAFTESNMDTVVDFFVYDQKLYVLGQTGTTGKLSIYSLHDLTAPLQTHDFGGKTVTTMHVDGDFYYVGTEDGDTLVFNTADYSERITIMGNGYSVDGLSSDNDHVYSVGSDGKVRAYNKLTFVLDKTIFPADLATAAVSNGTYAVVGTGGGKAYVYDKTDWTIVKTLTSQRIYSVTALFVDGERLYVGDAMGGIVGWRGWVPGIINEYKLASANGCVSIDEWG